MGISIRIYPLALKSITDAQMKAAKQTGEQILHETVSDAVMPFDEGTLQNVSTYVDYAKLDKGMITIINNTPYAARLYYHPEYNFQKTTNINAKGLWMEEWLKGSKMDRAAKLFAQFLKHNAGGYVK